MPKMHPPTTPEKIDAIQAIVDDINHGTIEDPINDRHIETGDWLEYVIEYEPDSETHEHLIDFSNVPAEWDVVTNVHVNLLRAGFMINTVDFENNCAHITDVEWVGRWK